MRSRATKKAINVSVRSELVEAARAERINLSATLESALEERLRVRRRQRWLDENSAAIGDYNRDVQESGTFGDRLRGF